MHLNPAARALALACTALLCATLLAGCGGGGDAAPVRENSPNRPVGAVGAALPETPASGATGS